MIFATKDGSHASNGRLDLPADLHRINRTRWWSLFFCDSVISRWIPHYDLRVLLAPPNGEYPTVLGYVAGSPPRWQWRGLFLVSRTSLLADDPAEQIGFFERLPGAVSCLCAQTRCCDGTSYRLPAAAVMTNNVAFVRLLDFVSDVWSAMKTHGLKYVAVVDDYGRPIGLLIVGDVLQALVTKVEYEEKLLRDYVMSKRCH